MVDTDVDVWCAIEIVSWWQTDVLGALVTSDDELILWYEIVW